MKKKILSFALSLSILAGGCLSPAALAAENQYAAAVSYAGQELPPLPDVENPKTTHPEGTVFDDEVFTIDMTFVGDCLLATYKGQYYEGSFSWYAANAAPTYFFEKVRDIFSADDFTVVNLENVLTDRPLQEIEKKTTPAYWFKAPTSNTAILTSSSVEAVSLANNHTDDYGAAGRADTIAAVTAAGLPYGAEDNTLYLEKNGFRIAVICHGLWDEKQASQIVTRIQEASAVSDY